MNKLFTKIAGLTLGLAMAIGVGVAIGGRDAKIARATDTVFTTTSSGGFSNNSKTSGGVTVTFAKASGDTNISWQSTHVRVYQKNTITISSSDTITEIAFSVSSGSSYTNTFSTNVGTVDCSVAGAVSWSGSTTSVVFTKSDGAQARVSSITVTHGSAVSDYHNDSNLPSTIEILYSSSFTDALPTAAGDVHSTATPNKVSGIAIREAGVYKGTSASYIMFKSGAGYLYNVESLGKISSVKLEYPSSGASASGKVLVSFGSNKISTKSTGTHTTVDLTNGYNIFNNSNDYGFFQISTTSANVQITKITITLANASVSINYAGSTSLEYDGSMTQTISMTASAHNISGTINYHWASTGECLVLTSANDTTSTSATFTIYSAGDATITVQAKVSGSTKATSAGVSFSITNKDYPGTLEITSSATINVDTEPTGVITYSLSREIEVNTLDVITVTSSNTSVIKFINEQNPLAYTAVGSSGNTATITLTLSCSTNNLESYSTSQLITLTSGIPVTGISLNFHSRTVKLGGSTMSLKATITPTNATNKNVVWESSDTSVVTVSGSAPNEDAESIGTLTGVNVGTATVYAKSDYDNSIVDSATVTVNAPDDKALQTIAIVKGSSAKTIYSENDTTVDTTGLTVNASYNSPTVTTYSETINLPANTEGLTWTLDLTNLRVVSTFGGKTAYMSITVTHEFSKVSGEYHLMSSNTLAVGDHIAIGGTVTAKDKAWSGHDFVMSTQASNNVRGAEITVSSKGIIANDETNNTNKASVYDIELVEGAVTGSFGLKVGEDTYLGSGSTSNRLQTKSTITEDSSFVFTYNSTTGLWSIVCQSTNTGARNYLYINANSGATSPNDYRLFACYGDTTPQDGYNYLKVYKFGFYVDEVETFANGFNNANVCGTNDNTKASGSIWSAQESIYATLTLGAQNIFKNGTGTTAAFIECLTRYDRVIYLHYAKESATYHDFMGRVANNQVTPRSDKIVQAISNSASATIIIVVISAISVAAISGYFLFRKKKDN